MRVQTCVFIMTFLCPFRFAVSQSAPPFVVTHAGGHPAIAVDDSGRAGVVWVDSSSHMTYYKCFDSFGNALTDTVRASLPPRRLGVTTPTIAINGQVVLVVWRNNDFTFNSYIMGRMFSRTGAAIAEQLQVNDTFFDAERISPRVLGMDDTTFLVVWSGDGPQMLPMGKGIYAQKLSSRGERIGMNVLLSDDSAGTQPNANPWIAHALNRDTMLVAWEDKTTRGNKIIARYVTKSLTPIGPSWPVTQDTAFAYCGSPAAGMDPDGNVSIAWSAEGRNGLYNVYLARYSREGALISAPISLDQEREFYPLSETRIAVDADGEMVVIWVSIVNGTEQVKGQRFDAHGNLLGNNFFVSVPTDTIRSYHPAVELKDDRIYVVWTDYDGRVLARFFEFYDPTLTVQEMSPPLIYGFRILQNYPNPFNPSTTIPIYLETGQRITLTVFDALGKEVQQIFAGQLGPGYHEFHWDIAAPRRPVATGTYFCRLSTSRSSQAIKLLILQ